VTAAPVSIAMSSTSSKRRRGVSIQVVDAKVAVDLATAQGYSENVFLFLPNIIGYTRIILAGISLHFMSYHPKYCTIAYVISCLLDALDGQAARALGQTSKFGAALDMVTDRCTTSCLLCYLASAYPDYAILFQFLIALDFSSHYMHMYSSLATGSRSHKLVTSDVSRILWLYYNDSRTLFFICAGNELFFCFAVPHEVDIHAFESPRTSWPILISGGFGSAMCADMLDEKHYQCCPAVEGI